MLRHGVLVQLGEPIRESPVLNASLRDLMTAVRAQGLEGLVAKRLDSAYEPGKRSGAWQKMRLNQGQEFVIGGYTPSPKNFDALVFGYYEGSDLMYAARTRNGFTPASREQLFRKFRGAGDLGMPIREPPRGAPRPVGPRAYRRKNEGVSMVATPVRRQLRICGVDA
jgi:bifunctional non-homologous end joining protein LigD